jgi:hypothetical protein
MARRFSADDFIGRGVVGWEVVERALVHGEGRRVVVGLEGAKRQRVGEVELVVGAPDESSARAAAAAEAAAAMAERERDRGGEGRGRSATASSSHPPPTHHQHATGGGMPPPPPPIGMPPPSSGTGSGHGQEGGRGGDGAVGRLIVTVVRARGLPAVDVGGGADPYVKLRCGGKEVRTSVRKGTREPVWGVIRIKILSKERDISAWAIIYLLKSRY